MWFSFLSFRPVPFPILLQPSNSHEASPAQRHRHAVIDMGPAGSEINCFFQKGQSGIFCRFRLKNAMPPRGQLALRAGPKFFTKHRNALGLGIVCAGLPPASRGRSHWWGLAGTRKLPVSSWSSSRDSRRRYSTYSEVPLYVTVGCQKGMGMTSVGPIAPHVMESRDLWSSLPRALQMSPPSVPPIRAEA